MRGEHRNNARLERGDMSNECVFCRIAARWINAYVVHEDERLVAFLDRGPIRTGHVQIVPRDHFPYFGGGFVEIREVITRPALDMSCSDRPAIEKGHEPVVFVDDMSIDLARRDPAKHTFVAHVASLQPSR